MGYYPVPPPGATVVEPFAGSAGYSTAVDSRKTVLYDCFKPIVLAWEFLINATEAELDAMPDRVDDIDDFPELNERQCMIIRWLLRRAERRPARIMGGWAKKAWPSATVWGPKRKQLIKSQLSKIKDWEIHHCGYEDIPVGKYDESTWWFVDPPYIDLKKNGYTFGPDKVNFEHLGSWCRNLPGKVIVCEMDGADWLPFRTLKDGITAANKRNYREVVWTKGLEDAGDVFEDE